MADLLAVRDPWTEVTAPRPAPPAPVVVIGLGNDIARDDGVGIHAAAALRVALADRMDVEVVALPWAGFALLDVLRDRRRAVLVDCLVTGRHAPGTIVRLDRDHLAGSVRLNSFHDIGLGTVLDLGRSLGWSMPAEIAIWAVEAAEPAEFSEELTPAVAAAVTSVVTAVARYLEDVA